MTSDKGLTFFILEILSLAFLCCGFDPVDNYLIDCGSSKDTIVGGRVFLADDSTTYSLSTPKLIFAKTSESVTSSNDSFLYQTARILDGTSKFTFSIQRPGRHWIRLYFYPFVHGSYNMTRAKFDVFTQDNFLLSNFSVQSYVVKEFSLNVTCNSLEITFRIPSKSSFAFLNALEVVSLPDVLITDDASTFNPVGNFQGMFSQALETLFRVNMGGPIIPPENDPLGRTWVSDQVFLVKRNVATIISKFSAVKYIYSGVTPDIAPKAVYGSATTMNSSAGDVNVTWEFIIDPGFQYLVRFHFCDIMSENLFELLFDVYIDSLIVIKDFDPSAVLSSLAAALYMDFVTASIVSNKLQVSIGPSSLLHVRPNAILNGLEIMKMNNSQGSLSKSPSILSHSASSRKKIGMNVGFITVAVIAIVLAAIMLYRKRKKFARQGHSKTKCLNSHTVGTKKSNMGYHIPFVAVEEATNSFDENWVVGIGGFGKVYKGVLNDGTKVAIKRLNPLSRQGIVEFQTEIEILPQCRHCNLVSLIGYCDEKQEMILIYEYMENGTLKNHLYGSGHPNLSWKKRLEICIGAARGLHYLHTGYAKTIIHRDVKSANILLDENLMAKVADFGLAKKVPEIDQSHVSTVVKGSFGYLDPEYFERQQLTEKSDVYSFGMVLFEVLCARPVTDAAFPEGMNLADWVMKWQKKGQLEQVLDPRLVGKIRQDSLNKFYEIAEKCLANCGINRPSMGDVMRNLEHARQLQRVVLPGDHEGNRNNMIGELSPQINNFWNVSNSDSVVDLSGMSMSKGF